MIWVSILVGGLLAYGVGVPWYMGLAKPWQAAARVSEADINSASALPYVAAVVGWLVAAFILNMHLLPGLVDGRGLVYTLRAIVGLWVCFGLLSTVLSTGFGNRGWNLLWIDGGYTLIGGLIIGLAYHFIA